MNRRTFFGMLVGLPLAIKAAILPAKQHGPLYPFEGTQHDDFEGRDEVWAAVDNNPDGTHTQTITIWFNAGKTGKQKVYRWVEGQRYLIAEYSANRP